MFGEMVMLFGGLFVVASIGAAVLEPTLFMPLFLVGFAAFIVGFLVWEHYREDPFEMAEAEDSEEEGYFGVNPEGSSSRRDNS